MLHPGHGGRRHPFDTENRCQQGRDIDIWGFLVLFSVRFDEEKGMFPNGAAEPPDEVESKSGSHL